MSSIKRSAEKAQSGNFWGFNNFLPSEWNKKVCLRSLKRHFLLHRCRRRHRRRHHRRYRRLRQRRQKRHQQQMPKNLIHFKSKVFRLFDGDKFPEKTKKRGQNFFTVSEISFLLKRWEAQIRTRCSLSLAKNMPREDMKIFFKFVAFGAKLVCLL